MKAGATFIRHSKDPVVAQFVEGRSDGPIDTRFEPQK